MQCETFEDRMHELLDRREPPEADDQLREHALVCEDCAGQLAAQESLFAVLKSGRTPELTADFTHRVLARNQPRPKNGTFNRLVIGLLVLAALLLIAILPAAWLLYFGDEAGHEGPGGGASIAEQRRPDRDLDSEINPRIDSPAPQNTPPEEDSKLVIVPPDDGTSDNTHSDYAGIPSFEDFQGEELKHLVSRVTTPLKPVTNSVNGAINVLRRTLAASPAWPLDPNLEEKPQADTSHPREMQDLA